MDEKKAELNRQIDLSLRNAFAISRASDRWPNPPEREEVDEELLRSEQGDKEYKRLREDGLV